ncbi:MAG: hypothetical protein DHS20C18_25580 [Saprospiraceae bacterium]|nr:MAG: hypothetical protein DHS20C18_25580 [Saprospiraceae bacterium]
MMNSFYMLRIYADSEEFYKIGISSAKTELELSRVRLKYIKEASNYNIEILHFIECNGCTNIEKFEEALLDLLSEYSYSPATAFDGRTECFKDNPIQILKNNSNSIYNALLKAIEKSIQDCQSYKEFFSQVFFVGLIKPEISRKLELIEKSNELIQVFELNKKGIVPFQVNNFKIEVKKKISSLIKSITLLILKNQKEINNSLLELSRGSSNVKINDLMKKSLICKRKVLGILDRELRKLKSLEAELIDLLKLK